MWLDTDSFSNKAKGKTITSCRQQGFLLVNSSKTKLTRVRVSTLGLEFYEVSERLRKADGISNFYKVELGCMWCLCLQKYLSCQGRIANLIDSICNNEETMSNWETTKQFEFLIRTRAMVIIIRITWESYFIRKYGEVGM